MAQLLADEAALGRRVVAILVASDATLRATLSALRTQDASQLDG